jgi:hypothetical protein
MKRLFLLAALITLTLAGEAQKTVYYIGGTLLDSVKAPYISLSFQSCSKPYIRPVEQRQLLILEAGLTYPPPEEWKLLGGCDPARDLVTNFALRYSDGTFVEADRLTVGLQILYEAGWEIKEVLNLSYYDELGIYRNNFLYLLQRHKF